MKLAIVLTGTVKPAVVGGNFSIEERMEMYVSTLRYYSKTIGKKYPIVFVENSDCDISHWETDIKPLQLEVLQFSPKDERAAAGFDNSKGKGYNEYLMIKKGISTSRLLNDPESQPTHFLKITGRYPMINILDMIREVERRIGNRDIVYFGDIKDTCIYKLMGRETLSSNWGDSRFFVAELDFYRREMMDCYQEMNDYEEGKWAEDYFLNLSRQYRKDPRFIFRYRHQVWFDGVSGTISSEHLQQGLKASRSFKSRLHRIIRRCLRILFPNIWF